MSEYLRIGIAALIPNLGGCAVGFIAKKHVPDWYDHLVKPKWHPPMYVFRPLSVCLYSSMGYASYLVWRDGGGFCKENALPLALYGSQLALNYAYTPIFFQYRKLGLATIEVGVLVGAIAATMISFHQVSSTAAHLMIPYLGLTCFFSTITFSIWKSNKDRTD